MKYMLKDSLRLFRDILFGIYCFTYDAVYYFIYSGVRNLYSYRTRLFKLAKAYHSIEKGLSSPEFDKSRGGTSIELVKYLLKRGLKKDSVITMSDIGAYKAIEEYEKASGKEILDIELRRHLSEISKLSPVRSGALSVRMPAEANGLGRMSNLYAFQRRSVRNYSPKKIPMQLVNEVINHALSAPSACNRSPWYVYKSVSREIIDEALVHQNGNKGFGHLAQGLFIVTVDLRAYDNLAERKQAWVDGGIFVMNLLTALHMEGFVSCSLNWCKYPWGEGGIRRRFKIERSRVIVSMIAFGFPLDEYKVCVSQRPKVCDMSEEL